METEKEMKLVKISDIQNKIYRDFMNTPNNITFDFTTISPPVLFKGNPVPVLLDKTDPVYHLKHYFCSELIRALDLHTQSNEIASMEWCRDCRKVIHRCSNLFHKFDKVQGNDILYNSLYMLRCWYFSDDPDVVITTHKLYLGAKIRREIGHRLGLELFTDTSEIPNLLTQDYSFLQQKKI